MTEAEKRVWNAIRRNQLNGHRFRRQQVIGPYIVDFACMEHKLIIEIDGGQHEGSAKDEARDHALKQQGFEILRFWNNEVLSNLEGVLHVIADQLPPPPNLPPHGGEEPTPQEAPK